MAYVQSLGLWDVARPHLEALVARTGESSSIAQLDGSDIVYVARVAVPKIIALRVRDRHPVPRPADLAGQGAAGRAAAGRAGRGAAEPSPGGGVGALAAGPGRADAMLRDVRAKGWALTDEQLAPGIRSVAAPLRDGAGRVFAAMNVTVHAAETSVETLTGRLPAAAAAGGRRGQRGLRPLPGGPGSRATRVGRASSADVRPGRGQGPRWSATGTAGPLERAAGRRLLPHPGRAVRVDAARPTSAPRWSRSRARAATTPAPGCRRSARASRPTTSAINRNKRSVALDLRGRATTPALARELAGRADVVMENFKPGGLARFGLDYDTVARGQPGRRLRVDQRLRLRRGRGAARLRPDRAGDLRADEPDRRPGRRRRTGPASRSST